MITDLSMCQAPTVWKAVWIKAVWHLDSADPDGTSRMRRRRRRRGARLSSRLGSAEQRTGIDDDAAFAAAPDDQRVDVEFPEPVAQIVR